MSSVDDLRKVLQDMVTPDLKAIDARVTALEKELLLRYDMLDQKIGALDQKFDLKYDTLDKKIDHRFDALDRKIDLKHEVAMAEIKALSADFKTMASLMAANQAAIMHSLEIDRRLERIESEMPARGGRNLGS